MNKTFFSLLAAALLSVAGLYLFAFFRPLAPVRRGGFGAKDRMLNIAHRGGSLEAPENTLYAFEKALQSGADVLEMDLFASADGVVFVFHDETLDRVTEASGNASEKTWAELKTLDAAYRWNPEDLPEPPYRGQGIQIPSLEEVFENFPDVPMILEIKPNDPAMVHRVGSLIEKHGRRETVVVASFHQRIIRLFRENFPRIPTSAGRAEVKRFYLLQRAGLDGLLKTPAHSFKLPEQSGPFYLLTEGMRGMLRRRGIDLYVWTVNEEPDMRRMISLGVQGIITDRPSVLAGIINQNEEKAAGGNYEK